MFCTTSVLEKCLQPNSCSSIKKVLWIRDTFPNPKSCKTLFLTTKAYKTCKTCSNWSKNSWKFRFVASELVVGSGEQDPNNIKIRPRRSGSTVPPAGARYSAMGGGGMHSPQQTPSLLMPSPTPTSAQQLLSQQVNKDVFYPSMFRFGLSFYSAMFCFGLSSTKSSKAKVKHCRIRNHFINRLKIFWKRPEMRIECSKNRSACSKSRSICLH